MHENIDTDTKMRLEAQGLMFPPNRRVCSRPHHFF